MRFCVWLEVMFYLVFHDRVDAWPVAGSLYGTALADFQLSGRSASDRSVSDIYLFVLLLDESTLVMSAVV